MIYHVFPLTAKHLSLDLIKQMQNFVKQNHFFVIADIVEDNTIKNEYLNLFNELQIKNYFFTKNLTQFQTFVPKNDLIILHGDNYNWKIALIKQNYKNIHWVCWGSGSSISKNLKSIISYPIKFFIYRKLKGIIVLSYQDQINLKKYFNLKNTELISYITALETSNNFDISSLKINQNLSTKIYVGNNSSCIDTYLPMIKKLVTYKNNISINCMLNYNLNEDKIYYNLVEFGKFNFNENFNIDKMLLSIDQYANYMNKCDNYICASEKQTGLGAIYTCLRLGKKIYLNGNNYNFLTKIGCKIFHIDEISSESFLDDLPLETKMHNFITISNFLSVERLSNLWTNYFIKFKPHG